MLCWKSGEWRCTIAGDKDKKQVVLAEEIYSLSLIRKEKEKKKKRKKNERKQGRGKGYMNVCSRENDYLRKDEILRIMPHEKLPPSVGLRNPHYN